MIWYNKNGDFMENLLASGKSIIQKLHSFGYEAYFVGGFVRDYLLGKTSDDIDITTNAQPHELTKIFPITKETGLKYGTITVIVDNHPFEVTTYRIDQKYENYRKPESVIFSKKLTEDLSRRDFTINALAMDVDGHIIDNFEGKKDLESRIIKAIGNPDERFMEDALRILRALRFVAKLGFTIEEQTLISMKKNINLTKFLPNERIVSELEKIFSYPHNKKTCQYMETIDFISVFPEFKQGLEKYKQSQIDLNFIEFMTLSLFLSKSPLPDYWRFSNKDKLMINKVVRLLEITKSVHFNSLLVYQAGLKESLMANKIHQVIIPMNNQEESINKIYQRLPIYKKSDLHFKGDDDIFINNLNNQEIIGEILDELELLVVNRHLENNHETLREYVRKLLERLNG